MMHQSIILGMETDLISIQFWIENYHEYFLPKHNSFYPHLVIFIHYKSRIATAIRGLQWIQMTMVNSGLKGLSTTFQACMIKIKRDINQQDLKIVDLHVVKSE